jgi:hypothetical protein
LRALAVGGASINESTCRHKLPQSPTFQHRDKHLSLIKKTTKGDCAASIDLFLHIFEKKVAARHARARAAGPKGARNADRVAGSGGGAARTAGDAMR